MKTCKDVKGVRINLKGFLHITPEVRDIVEKPLKYRTMAEVVNNIKARARMFGYDPEVEVRKASALKNSVTEEQYDAEQLLEYRIKMGNWEQNNKKVTMYIIQFPNYKYILDHDPFEEEL
jgi:hypothetical protein